jgi:hypothetical protein
MVEYVGIAALLAAVVIFGVRLARKVSARLDQRRDARLKSHIDWINPAPRRRSRLIL